MCWVWSGNSSSGPGAIQLCCGGPSTEKAELPLIVMDLICNRGLAQINQILGVSIYLQFYVLLRMASSEFDLMSVGSMCAGSSGLVDKISVENICTPKLPV